MKKIVTTMTMMTFLALFINIQFPDVDAIRADAQMRRDTILDRATIQRQETIDRVNQQHQDVLDRINALLGL